MTIDEVKKWRYWVDECGNIWECQDFCLEPTVSFERLRSFMSTDGDKPFRVSGGVGSMNFAKLKPLTDERLKS